MTVLPQKSRRTIRAGVVLAAVGCLVVMNARAQERLSKRNWLWQVENKQRGDNGPQQPPYVARAPLTCESFVTLVDNARVEWQQIPESFMIFIARLGEGEKSGHLISRRFRDIEDYLKRDKDIRYVLAQGNRADGLGKIELYVGGRLSAVIPVKRNDKRVCSGRVNPFLSRWSSAPKAAP
jgi:hypothetical protein